MDAIQKYDICTQALADYARGAGFTQAVIGLSGGIDSAVCACIAKDAFGAENVHGVMLPGPYSSKGSLDDAKALAKNLGIEAQVISILEPYEAFENILAAPCGGELAGLAGENTQARCRMVILMALSNRYNWILVNTGNRSEAMMGYSTLYGDTAGAFAPIGGLYKTDVFAVARARNERAVADGQVAPIPDAILTKPPSAELAPGQQDEKSMGIAYAKLDPILLQLVEGGKAPEEVEGCGCSIEQVRKIQATVSHYAFKRAMEPPFPDAKFYD